MAFILILSPKSAPPVFLFEGSTDIMANVLSFTSIKNLRTNSSTKDDFPDPPVPVMPNTGAWLFCVSFFKLFTKLSAPSGSFSATVIAEAMLFTSFFGIFSSSVVIARVVMKSVSCNMWLIMPCKPILRPSSGE